jgi:ATP-dependent DNA helicase DinG
MSKNSDVVEKTSYFFGVGSPLKNAPEHGGREYEERPQQKEIAVSVAKSLLSSENLCIEAPTGVGKSFAYLVPSIFYSLESNKPVIVSSETINLQEQLVNKELPLLKKLIKLNFTYAIAKGRNNYICKRKLDLVLSKHSQDYLPENIKLRELARIAKWSENTYDGSKDSLDFIPSSYLWKSVCCEFNNCMNTTCNYYSSCFYKKACSLWKTANIVVTNHSMFFSDLKNRMTGRACIFPELSGLVIDEAHSLENSASKHLGSEISELKMYEFLKKLYNPFTSRGLLSIKPKNAKSLMDNIILALDEVKTFFNILRAFVEEEGQSSRRIKEHINFNNSLLKILSRISNELFKYICRQEDEEFKLELNNQLMVCDEFIDILSNAFNMTTDKSVYWGEIKRGAGNDSVLFKYAPLNIAEILKKY